MPKRGKRSIARTQSGRRALRGAKTGESPFKGRSIRTASVQVSSGKKKRQVILVPTVVKKKSGGFVEFGNAGDAAREALRKGDFARVGRPAAAGSKSLAKSERKATKRSKKFSKRLGRISRKRKKS